MTERELLDNIVNAARARGWRCAHFASVEVVLPGGEGRTRWMTPARKDGKGFPDLFMLRERPLLVEVKGGSHAPTPEQQDWIFAARMAGIRAFVWTPARWDDGTVEAELHQRIPYVPADAA